MSDADGSKWRSIVPDREDGIWSLRAPQRSGISNPYLTE